MGGFRSQPLTVKETVLKELPGLSYAMSSMCGMFSLMQDGGSTWRMPTSAPLSPIKSHTFSLYSMDTEVPNC